MAQSTIWLQGSEGKEEITTGWSNDWNKIYIDHTINLKDIIPLGSVINKIELSTDASSNVGITAGYIRIDIFNSQGQKLYNSNEVNFRTSWVSFPPSNFGGDLSQYIKNDGDYKIRLNCKGTERKWYFRNSKLVIDYTEPVNNIYIGTSKIKEIYIGTTPVKEVYAGTKQVF